jgi:hypothetical protein
MSFSVEVENFDCKKKFLNVIRQILRKFFLFSLDSIFKVTWLNKNQIFFFLVHIIFLKKHFYLQD